MKSSKMSDRFSVVVAVLSTLVALAALTLAACGPAPEAVAGAAGPEAVVEEYYAWYLDYIGDRASGEFRNPLVDRAYRDSELLTPAFVVSVDELLESFDRSAYDPFLCAQDIPESISVSEATVSGEEASVVVETSFAGHSFEVELEMMGGEWLISDVVCTPPGE
jgi:hypothetical protein